MLQEVVFLLLTIPLTSIAATGDTGNSQPSAHQSTSTQSAASRLPLTPCRVRGIDQEVLCGKFEVYEDRARKAGRKISLNIVVLPATSATPAPDPLFVLYGGPGQAATQGAAGDARRFAQIRRERDIVLVDQRGTGQSNGLTCNLGLKGTIEILVTSNFSTDEIRECRRELEQRADLRFYTTPTAMDDLDEVRAWLGYDKINLYGGSYGTRAALVYMERHPEHVRTSTLRGVFTLNPAFFARDAQRALDMLFDDCAKDADCAKAYPNVRQNLQTILERLEKSPVKLIRSHPRSGEKIEIEITRDAFAGAIRRLLYDSNTQRRIPLMIHKAMEGNYQPFEDAIDQATGIMNSFSVGMFLSVSCPERAPGNSREEIARESKNSFLGDRMSSSALAICSEWPQGKLPANYFEPVRSDAPALILSGNIDPVTPPVWGEQAAKSLPNSLHLTMEGIAHGPFPDCASDIMAKFVQAGTTKGLDTTCIKSLTRPSFILPSSVLSVSFESSNADERELVRLEHEWIEMSAQADRNKLNDFLPDDFRQMGLLDWSENRANKARWIDRVIQVTTQVENGVFNLEKPQVNLYGDMATVNARWVLKGTMNGRSISNTIVVFDIWNKRDGKWMVVTRHLMNAPASGK